MQPLRGNLEHAVTTTILIMTLSLVWGAVLTIVIARRARPPNLMPHPLTRDATMHCSNGWQTMSNGCIHGAKVRPPQCPSVEAAKLSAPGALIRN